MCGIAGILSSEPSNHREIAERMAESLYHRGPDSGGVWVDEKSGIALSHRRLSILDLSSLGNQPMLSHDSHLVLSYNGEIYNYSKIKREMEKDLTIEWRGHSDTEVLLAAIRHRGIRKALRMTNGMFAFALWDRRERKLTLARDRMGEKPLYIGWIGKNIIFASELKAFRHVPNWERRINKDALGYLLRFGYIPAPLSIYEGVFKMLKGHYTTLCNDECLTVPTADGFQAKCTSFWDHMEKAITGTRHPAVMDESEAIDGLDRLLQDSVKSRMVADVPVGSLLSGGIDSSLVTAVMQTLSSTPVKTYTIGFEEDGFDESGYAREIADHIGSEHTEVLLTHQEALKVIPKIPEIYDEPFADASQIPTILLSTVARRGVSVALSGDGGDELFSGYERYGLGMKRWRLLKCIPHMIRAMPGQLLIGSSQILRNLNRMNDRKQFVHRLWRMGMRLNADNFNSFHTTLVSQSLLQTSTSNWPVLLPPLENKDAILERMDVDERMMIFDQCFYLPDDILVKTDRASMSVGLELRAPFLDDRIVRFALKLPKAMKRKGRNGKLILRKILYRYVPRNLADRPKRGFRIPHEEWLRGALKEWMMDLLNPKEIAMQHYLDNDVVQRLVREHISGIASHGYALWPVLMFQAWLSQNTI